MRLHRWCFTAVLAGACEQTQPPPPSPPTPVPPPPVDAPPPAPDAPAATPDLQCHAEVFPKNWFEIKTDLSTMTGVLRFTATGPVPTRVIHYRAVPGPTGYDLVFVSFDARDYTEMHAPRPARPRKQLVPGKSVVARVYLDGGRSRIVGGEIDLHTGTQPQTPDHSYPCRVR